MTKDCVQKLESISVRKKNENSLYIYISDRPISWKTSVPIHSPTAVGTFTLDDPLCITSLPILESAVRTTRVHPK